MFVFDWVVGCVVYVVDKLGSFDITNLQTSIPINETIEILKQNTHIHTYIHTHTHTHTHTQTKSSTG